MFQDMESNDNNKITKISYLRFTEVFNGLIQKLQD